MAAGGPGDVLSADRDSDWYTCDASEFAQPRPREFMSFICRNYVMFWSLPEMIRELLCNATDEIFSQTLPHVADRREYIKIRAGGADSEGLAEGDFDFYWETPVAEHVVGTIRHSEAERMLRFTNPGAIPLKAFMMGASTRRDLKASDRASIVGTFGEGMKLAFLCGLRLGKTVLIRTGGQIWAAGIRHATRWEEAAMHYSVAEDPNAREVEGKVVTEIHNISKAEWFGSPASNVGIFGNLLLLESLSEHDVQYDPKPVCGKDAKKIGRLLLADFAKGRLFNNGVFVRREGFFFGYDLVNLRLNRDRSALHDVGERRTATSRVLVDLVENHVELMQNPEFRISWDLIRKKITELISRETEETFRYHVVTKQRLGAGAPTTAADVILSTWRETTGHAIAHPVNPSENVRVTHKMLKEKISSQVYPMVNVSVNMYETSRLSQNYVTFEQRLDKLAAMEEFTDLSPAQEAHRDNAMSLASHIDPAATHGLAIVFKRFESRDLHFRRGNKVFLSVDLLDAPLAIYGTLVDVLGFSAEAQARASAKAEVRALLDRMLA